MALPATLTHFTTTTGAAGMAASGGHITAGIKRTSFMNRRHYDLKREDSEAYYR